MSRVWLRGARGAVRDWRAAVWVYVAATLCALPAALVAGALVRRRFATSLDGEAFARGVEPLLFGQFVRAESDSLRLLLPVLLASAVLWLVLSTYLSGAILSAAASSERLTTAQLFANGALVFGRLMRLLGFALVFVTLVGGGAALGLFKLGAWLVEDWVSETGALTINLAALVLVLLVVAWASAAVDLMKIEMVLGGEARAYRALARGLRRALKRPFALLAVFVPFALTSLLFTVATSLIDVHLSRDGWLAILLGVVVQQATVFARAFVRVGLATAEVTWVCGEAPPESP